MPVVTYIYDCLCCKARGSGSGSGGGGTISTTCCPGLLLPVNLQVTLSGAVNGSVTLTYNSGTQKWSTAAIAGCGGSPPTGGITVAAQCITGGWQVGIGGQGCGGGLFVPIGSFTCSPLLITGSFTIIGCVACNGQALNFSITT